MKNTYRRIVKFVYVILVPVLLATIDISLVVMGKFQYAIESHNYGILLVLGLLNVWGFGAVYLFMYEFNDISIIPKKVKLKRKSWSHHYPKNSDGTLKHTDGWYE